VLLLLLLLPCCAGGGGGDVGGEGCGDGRSGGVAAVASAGDNGVHANAADVRAHTLSHSLSLSFLFFIFFFTS
jgi:hypothetical protein